MRTSQAFERFAWGTLLYTIFVIIWGAFVRASGSGAGCGDHWPLCNGQITPHAPSFETMVELSHRITSGLSLILVIAMTVWAFRRFDKGHPVRGGAVASTVFILLEAALGAGLVLLKLVADNSSTLRAVAIALHLVNTFALLSAIAYTAWAASRKLTDSFTIRADRGRCVAIGCNVILFLLVGASGAIVALGDTLFPPSSISEGLRQDFSPTVHFLIKLRLWHPLFALLLAFATVFAASYVRRNDPRPLTGRLSRALVGIVLAQVLFGFANMFFLAPVWMQLIHLGMADVCWILLVCLGFQTLPYSCRTKSVDRATSPSLGQRVVTNSVSSPA